MTHALSVSKRQQSLEDSSRAVAVAVAVDVAVAVAVAAAVLLLFQYLSNGGDPFHYNLFGPLKNQARSARHL